MKRRIRKTIRRADRFLKNRAFEPLIASLILAVIISLLINVGNTQETTRKTAEYEITETDIFSLDNFNANNVSVMGIKVGDRTQDVLSILGTPDIKTDFEGGITNLEYSNAIGLSATGIIVSLSNNFVNSITIKEPFQKHLVGETRTDLEKDEIYRMFGVPDKTLFMPLKENSAKIIRIISYETIGLDFIVSRNKAIGFSLVLNDGTKSDFDPSKRVVYPPPMADNS
ncbi:MAG: hypothetical protein Q8Q42_03670 [Nanoarchaeota archaeon]|nr:hypothetical protein [Nanoarchaeota archaeon]